MVEALIPDLHARHRSYPSFLRRPYRGLDPVPRLQPVQEPTSL
jgi:hypothetical protein